MHHRWPILTSVAFVALGNEFLCHQLPVVVQRLTGSSPDCQTDDPDSCMQLSVLHFNSLFTIANLLSAFGAIFAGYLADRFGTARLTYFGAAIVPLGQLLVCISPYVHSDSQYPIISLGQALLGLTDGVLVTVTHRVKSSWFGYEELGVSFAVHVVSAKIGASLVFLLYGAVLPTVGLTGCLWIGLVVAVGVFVVAVVMGYLDARHLSLETWRTNTPEGGLVREAKHTLHILRGFPYSLWIIVVSVFFFDATIYTFVVNGPNMLADRYHFTESRASYISGLVYYVEIIAPLFGYLCDRYGHRDVWLLFSGFLVVLGIFLSYAGAVPPGIYASLLGLGDAAYSVASTSCISILAGNRAAGISFGLLKFLESLGDAVWTVVAGGILLYSSGHTSQIWKRFMLLLSMTALTAFGLLVGLVVLNQLTGRRLSPTQVERNALRAKEQEAEEIMAKVDDLLSVQTPLQKSFTGVGYQSLPIAAKIPPEGSSPQNAMHHRWPILATIGFLAFCNEFLCNQLPVLVQRLTGTAPQCSSDAKDRDHCLNLTVLHFNSLFTVGTLLSACGAILAGHLADRFGTTRVAYSCAGFLPLGQLLIAVSPYVVIDAQYPVIIIGQVLLGLSDGTLITLTHRVKSSWFGYQELGVSFAVHSVMAKLGASTVFLGYGFAVPHLGLTGCLWVSFGVALCVCASAITMAYLDSRNPALETWRSAVPEGLKEEVKHVFYVLRGLPYSLWIVVAAAFFQHGTEFSFVVNAPNMFADRYNFTESRAGYTAGILYYVQIIAPLFGFLTDHFGHRDLWLFGSGSLVVLGIFTSYASRVPPGLYTAFLGLGDAAYSVSATSSISVLAGSSGAAGIAFGLLKLSEGVGDAVWTASSGGILIHCLPDGPSGWMMFLALLSVTALCCLGFHLGLVIFNRKTGSSLSFTQIERVASRAAEELEQERISSPKLKGSDSPDTPLRKSFSGLGYESIGDGSHKLASKTEFNLNSTSHHPNSTSVFVTLSSYEIVRISIFLAIFIISVVANSVLLVNFWRRSNNKSSGRILLKWLVWINTWQTVVILPCAILFFIQRSIEPFSGASGWQVVCKSLISFFLEWCTRFSWILVGLIAVERFYACVRSVTYRREFPVTRLGGLIGCIFCVNFIVSISPFLARMDAGLHPQRHFCTIQRAGYKTYAVLDVAFFGLPLGVMVYCWGRIFALAWSKRLKVYLGNIAVEPAEAIEGPIFTGLAESSATTTTTTLATDASDRHIVPSTTHTVKTFLRRSTSKDSNWQQFIF
ncbi:hypothetical protein BV898_13858 [Hypsibius exemplaris]|uniref:Lysosomal dipeptide transporter MFSD1 n=1 Tax=Hypsibius exemplaris TaxID=2072580 RepID=A0A1W0W9K5_HYPEX|nr:hypothetical protein BV898_13858 [Hypsibius exemplaris]